MGYEIEVLQGVFDQMGIQADYSELPWKRCLMKLEYGEADVLVSMLHTPQREKYTWFPETRISCSKIVFFTRKGVATGYDGSLASLKREKIGFVLGFDYGEEFAKAKSLNKDVGLNAISIIKKVINGHNDVGLENEYVVRSRAKELGVLNQLTVLEPAYLTKELFVGFSKKTMSQEFVVHFSDELKKFKKSSDYQIISNKYDLFFP